MDVVSTVGEGTVVSPDGDLNEVTAASLRRELNRLVAGGCREIVMDLARIREMDAFGLGVLCAARTTLNREKGSFSVINASPELETLLRRTGLSRHVSISTAE